jgi:hypothetical protein
MDDRVRLLLCALSGAGLFGLLGLVFGAAAGATLRAGGRAAGGILGLTAARALEKARGRELSDVATGVVVGGVDGLTFLGVVGTGFGLLYGYVGEAQRELLVQLAMGVGLLAAGAALFGTLATGLVRGGVWGVGVVFVGALGGCAIGARVAGLPGLVYGVVFGLSLGAVVGLTRGNIRPAPPPPPVEEEEPDR